MSRVPLLTEAQMRRIEPFFPISRGLRRVDDRRVISGIIYVIRTGLQWKDALRGYSPHKTLYNRFVRWSRLGAFDRIFKALVARAGVPERLMIDSTHLKAHRTAASWQKRGCFTLHRTHLRGGPNSKLHAVCDEKGRFVRLLLTAGQTNDHKGAAMRLPVLPQARELLGDRGYDSADFHADLLARGIQPCIPSTRKRKTAIPHDSTLYRHSHTVSRTHSAASKTGAASPRATTDAPTRSSPPSASPQPLSSGCRNES